LRVPVFAASDPPVNVIGPVPKEAAFWKYTLLAELTIVPPV
jgi:hypothetical protein